MTGILPLTLTGLGYTVDGQALLGDVSATIGGGRLTVVLGPNGAGKSLLLRLCHGLLEPTAGGLRWSGDFTAAELRRRQAMVFQRPVMLRRSALANVEYALAMAGLGHRQRRPQAMAALAEFGLAGLAQRPARVLSGGEQQRLALARAWAMKPEILFLDEPTSALDPAATYAVENAVRQFHAVGTTVVMSTHDLVQARRLAEDVLFLCRGRLLESAAADAFFQTPQSPEARSFLAGQLVW